MHFSFKDVGIRNPYIKKTNSYMLAVFGDCWEDIPDGLEGIDVDFIKKLDFDGGYTAFYRNLKDGSEFVFQGQIDLFSMYYVIKEDVVYFSDDFYKLLSYIDSDKCQWNIEAISDYFEGTWNNIVKYDRSPIMQIKRLDVGTFLNWSSEDNSLPIAKKWNEYKEEPYKYTQDNLEDFKETFFETLDYYLSIINKRYDKVLLTVSGGIDCNTITAEYCRMFPEAEPLVFTSKIGGAKDESDLAMKMQDIIKNPIHIIPIELRNDGLLKRLYRYIQNNLPPRYFNELSEDEMSIQLKNRFNLPCLSGMAAENSFGFFDNEYYYLVKKYFNEMDFRKAYDVFTAAKKSYLGYSEEEINYHFVRFVISFFEKRKKDQISESIESPLIIPKLPRMTSSYINSWKDAIDYACYSGELKAMWYDYERNGMKVLFPFAGRKFYELGRQCDPFIFSNKVNKSCIRYAVSDLLPKEITSYTKKMGNPGQDYREIIFDKNNCADIIEFIMDHESTIINREFLLDHINKSEFGHYEFLALSLMVFEDIIKTKWGKELYV